MEDEDPDENLDKIKIEDESQVNIEETEPSLEKIENTSQKIDSIIKNESSLMETAVNDSESAGLPETPQNTVSLLKDNSDLMETAGGISEAAGGTCDFLHKRSPYIHDPPYPEERRGRIENPRTPKDYIINLREDLADYQESHGLPRTRDYSFMSLGMALLQETARAIYSLFLMFKEMFPIVAIVSLLMRFALDKLIEILETEEAVPKLRKTIIFALELLLIIIPLWILITSIIIPLLALIVALFKSIVKIGSGKRCSAKRLRRKGS